MKSICAGLLLAVVASLASARPVVIEESATLANPDPSEYVYFGRKVATNGEYALTLGTRDEYTNDGVLLLHRAALLYRRVAGQWQFQQVLGSTARGYDSYVYPSLLAMKGNLAVIELDGNTEAFRLGPNGWQSAGVIGNPYEDLEIDGQRIAVGSGGWDANVFDPNDAGGWTGTFLRGQPRGSDDEFWGGPVDIDGDRVIIGTPYTFDLEDQEIPIYQRSAGSSSWNRVTSIVSPFGYYGFADEVALRGDDAVIDSFYGAYVYRLSMPFEPSSRLQPPDAYQRSIFTPRRAKIEKSGDLVLVLEPNYDRGTPVINVYRAIAASPGHYDHVAVLAPSGGGLLINSFDVSGNVVIASGAETAYIFELPGSFAPPAPRQDNFETGNAAGWSTIAGSQFSVATSGSNHIYRQSSITGDARALLGNTNWTNQAIEAQVTPTLFDGNDRWVGLITRYQNAQNYFYVTLRSSGSVQLKRMRAGVSSTIASAPLSVTVNRRYRLRLESVGSAHRVYVNGVLLLDADDAGTPRQGSAGITMYRARADFDNVVVSPSPLNTVFANDFSTEHPGAWTINGGGQWLVNSGTYSQNSVAPEARAVIGGPTADQIVQARVRQTAWSTTGTAERWAGVLARYTDNGNYYYLHLRSGGTVSLRKLVNGAIFTLASVPFAVSVGTQYTLRLEVVGNQLRGYVNDTLMLQATDSSHAAGISGLMTSKAAAQFDDYLAYQP